MSLSGLAVLVKTIKALRGVLMALIFLVILLPVIMYVVLSSQWASTKIQEIGQRELSDLLGTEVNIGEVRFSPFNRLGVYNITAKDDNGQQALAINEIETRFEIWDLIFKRKIIIDYATIDGLNLKLYRDSLQAPLNIQNIISRLENPDTTQAPKVFKLRLNDVSLNDCAVSYDVLSAPETPERFNSNHIKISNLRFTAFAPIISNDKYNVRLRALSLNEQSGFRISDLSVNFELKPTEITIGALSITLPNSNIQFGNLTAPLDGYNSINDIAKDSTIAVSIIEGSHVYLPDLKAFVPQFKDVDYNVEIDLQAEAMRDSVDIKELHMADPNHWFGIDITGRISKFTDLFTLTAYDTEIDIKADKNTISAALASANTQLNDHARDILENMGNAMVKGHINGSVSRGDVDITIGSNLAHGKIKGLFNHVPKSQTFTLNGKVTVDSLSLGVLTNNDDFGQLSADADIHGTFTRKTFKGDAATQIGHVDYKGYRIRDINAEVSIADQRVKGEITSADRNVKGRATVDWYRDEGNHAAVAYLDIERLRLDTLGITQKYPGYTLKGNAYVNGFGTSLDRFKGDLSIDNLSFSNKAGEGIKMRDFDIFADNITSIGRIVITSDYINGTIDGPFHLPTLKADIQDIYQTLIPALDGNDTIAVAGDTPKTKDGEKRINKFSVDLTLSNCEKICEFFKLPIVPIAESTIKGNFDGLDKSLFMIVDVPWIESGNSYIQYTNAVINLNTSEDKGSAFFTSYIPTKKGNMDIEASVNLNKGAIDTDIYWSLMPEKPISGNIDFTTELYRDYTNELITQIRINPGTITFGDEIWDIRQSYVTYGNKKAIINGFVMQSQNQSLRVNGIVGDEETDHLTADLKNIQLINIFETLDIGAVLISGYATGTINATALLSKNPIINCERLDVQDIGYNYCTLGDAEVSLSVDEGGRLFNFDANITQPEGYRSYLNGYIEPSTESLQLNIDADHVNVGFMQPFMKAFTSDVKGQASGKATLFGTFKNIDLKGDIMVDSVRIKIDFTNTWYYASDPIKLTPGRIDLPNITITDEYGHKALLNGWVSHKYFHDAAFEFKVNDAKNFLSYDITDKQNSKWYGRVFADGSVSVKGRPGIVDIGVNMTTAANSTFTLVLSDQAVADEYSFITFRDLTPAPVTDSILDKNTIPDRVLDRRGNQNKNEDSPTAYNIDIAVAVTPQAQINLIMDPVGGDRIRSWGSGNVHMYYGSANNDLRLYGTYTLERGNYNFTLQDLIVRDFTIKPGSKITFNGDPYSADVDISAYLQVNANLADLDESFLQDKELNRTNVPVRALMLVTGDIRQPHIGFGLEFPTLPQDIDRKVKSIVSTEDMMTKQIIYLLALNRFYTPEYMGATAKGNELFSVASSTLSSQLSNMLGKLSDNWSIAPNLRSDRGDFSDIEVDVTLSSSLLNNRLLFNGNFGYRDKSMNTNQFVGDFDVEYLLNRSGEWRLKAYNRYNDQNYYLRTAQTTQGIGLVYRRDFDKTFRFLDKLFRKKDKAPADSVVNDTIIIDTTIEIPEDNKPQNSINTTDTISH